MIDVQWEVPESQRVSSEASMADAKSLPSREKGATALKVGDIAGALELEVGEGALELSIMCLTR